ncbi:MAG: hypothetical protein WCV90_06170 [Candidatus Woesearchaeota archaeon]|jgi:acetoin utilization deacetylase AcuC-like enzyme
MEDQDLINNLMGYLSQKGNLTIEDIHNLSYKNPQLYYRSFMEFLHQYYPESHKSIIDAIGDIKSHGMNFTVPQKIVDLGMACFPKGYLEENKLPKHTSLKSLKCVFNHESYPIETFPGKTTRRLKNYLLEREAQIKFHNSNLLDLVKKVHPETDFLNLCARRLKRDKITQDLDDVETPLLPEVVKFALNACSVLFAAEKEEGKVVIAVPGIPGAKAEPDHEVEGCYFNNEAIFALEQANQGKKIAILDLNASFNHGLFRFCFGHKNIMLIGIHVDPLVDPTLSYRQDSTSKLNSYQYNLEVGTNGHDYLVCLEKALKNIPENQDLLLVIVGTNSYLLDSVGLLCVEAQYFRKFGEIIGMEASKKKVKKIILTPGEGYEEVSPQLLVDFCLGMIEKASN